MHEIINTKKLKVVFHEKSGTYDIYGADNRLVVKNAYCELATVQGKHLSINRQSSFMTFPYAGQLGDGFRTRIEFESEPEEAMHLQLDLITYKNLPFITAEFIVTNNSDKPIEIVHVSPMSTYVNNDSGVFIADTPENALIFENGLGPTLEFFLRSFNAREESESSMMEFLYAKDDMSKNLLVGLISLEDYFSEVVSNDEEDEGIVIDDREAIAEWRCVLNFPFPKKLMHLDTISSGKWVIMVDSDDGFSALETYADLIRKQNHINLWKYEVPHGWNSWGNPVKEYRDLSYVTQINEQIILNSLDAAEEHLKRFGLKYWQLDSGWMQNDILMPDHIMEDRFPHGMKHIADKIHEKGIKAGIWINPFNVGVNSPLVKEKQSEGWFAEPDPTFPIHDKSWRALDLTVPGAQDYLRHVIRKVVKEWGFDMLKVDFAYHNMCASEYSNSTKTNSQVHRLGWKIIREEAGEDIFIYGIGGPLALHMGYLNGERISLDTLPVWHDEGVPQNMFDVPQTGGSVCYNYRTMVRRYFLNGRVWYNHLDCLCFRPSLERDETMMLANAMALLGGIFKIGDKITQMKAQDLAVIQKMLPIYKGYCRPVDLFEKMLPEIINLPVEKEYLQWNVVGVFNWGVNKNLITGEDMLEQEKDIKVVFESLGLDPEEKYHIYDFWNHKYLGRFQNSVDIHLKPHVSKLLGIHRDQKRPQFLSSNRHITQGGIGVNNVHWNEESKVLRCEMDVVRDFEHMVTFHVPSNHKLKEISIEGIDEFTDSLNQDVLNIRFNIDNSPKMTSTIIKLNF